MRAAVALLFVAWASAAGAQEITYSVDPDDQAVSLVFYNREITSLRARVLGRRPDERMAGARKILEELAAQGITTPVELRPLAGGQLIVVGGRAVFGLVPPDVDELSGTTVDQEAAQAADRLRAAFAESAAARKPAVLARSISMALLVVLAGGLLLWGIAQLYRRMVNRFIGAAEQRVARTGVIDVEALRGMRLFDLERAIATTAFSVLALVVCYAQVTFALRQFPYTRPWGDSMRGFLIDNLASLGASVVRAIPGLFTAVLLVLGTRFLVRLMGYWFDAVQQGRVQVRWIHPETARPTRRLIAALLWLVTIVMAYPYLPGSQTEAFKGMTVFLGLIVTFGSTGLMNQIMSGLMITYSRALRLGDFVRIGEVEGTVTHVGMLSTKLRTIFREEVTVPNAVVVGQTTKDFTRSAEAEGIYTPTTITIGYDTPWRQVQALLLLAAERTPGLKPTPPPVVVQLSLEDFYVKYALLVSIERQDMRALALNALHANIQDLFNEYGVQIMSPNYIADPASPKVVAREHWAAAPARPDRAAGAGPPLT